RIHAGSVSVNDLTFVVSGLIFLTEAICQLSVGFITPPNHSNTYALSTDRHGYDIQPIPRNRACPFPSDGYHAPIWHSSKNTNAVPPSVPDPHVPARAVCHHISKQ